MPSAFTTLPRALVWLTLGGAACVTPQTPAPLALSEFAQAIPLKARAVKVYSDELPAEYYRTVYRALGRRGFVVQWWNEDERSRTFSTDFQGDYERTTLRLHIVVEAVPGGSVATLRGEWRESDFYNNTQNIALEAGGMGSLKRDHAPVSDAIWRGGRGGASVAFYQMAVIANALPHTRVEYVMR